MSQALAQALQVEGLWRLLVAAAVGGLVRGFSGFGGALIYMPAAATVLTPVWALITLTLMDIAGPVPNLRGAWAAARRREVAILLVGAALALPLGLWLLSRLPQDPFRWGLSGLVFGLLALMAAGWRYRRALSDRLVAGIGALGGLLGGLTGVAGPPVILFYMAAGHPPAVMRANLILYFFAIDCTVLALMGGGGLLAVPPLAIALLTAPVYMLANVLGARAFRPERAGAYRWIAYGVIAASAVLGLPVWG